MAQGDGTGEEGPAPVILFVEDDEDTRQIVHRWLREMGAVAVAAHSAAGALEFCRASVPSLILTDLHMPHMDGEAFIEALHEELAGLMPPVVILTGAKPRGWIPKAPGVAGVLHKPAERAQVLHEIRRCLPARAPGDGADPLG